MPNPAACWRSNTALDTRLALRTLDAGARACPRNAAASLRPAFSGGLRCAAQTGRGGGVVWGISRDRNWKPNGVRDHAAGCRGVPFQLATGVPFQFAVACRENPRTNSPSSPPVCAAPRRPPLKAGRSGAARRSEANGERRRPGAQRKPRDARESASARRGACAPLADADLPERVNRHLGREERSKTNFLQKPNPAACWRGNRARAALPLQARRHCVRLLECA